MAILAKPGRTANPPGRLPATETLGLTTRRSRVTKACGVLVVFAVCIIAAGLSSSDAKGPSESEVKAAFVFNFAKFVEWPAQSFLDAGTPISIGILGEKQFADEVERLTKGKTINGRRIEVKRIDKDKDADGCHILFIRATEKRRFGAIMERLKDAGVLIVGETEGFIRSGGVIGFVVEDRKVGFEINAEAARKRRLKISSQLLKLARNVKE